MRINSSSLCLGVIATVVLAPAMQAKEPWDAPFADNPKAILEEARRVAVPDGTGIIILLEQHQYVIDAGGRTVSTVRKVFWIAKRDAVESWSSVEQEYAPWHEAKPELRARVITADGMVHWLDPKTIADSPASEFDSSIFSDRRVARAPLPAVAEGAVVEYEIVVRETAPLLNAGVTRRIFILDHIPIQRFRLSIEAAKNVVVQTAAQLIPETAIRRHVSSGSTHVDCELGPLGPRKTYEANLPTDTPAYPYIAFSTGRSWQEIATQ